jgi:8-oxo-dGTP diphosphatase
MADGVSWEKTQRRRQGCRIAMTTVVAAIVHRDGRLLVCQRRRDASFPFKWEFPGGKLAPGETPEQALARELREELGVAAEIGREIYRTRHRYPELAGEIDLRFFAARLRDDPWNLAFERIEWAELARLAQYDFLAADRELVELLARNALALE